MKPRRRFLFGSLAALVATRVNAQARIEPAVKEIAKGAAIQRGRVKLELPIIADNGNAVPVRVVVESPMTAPDHVKAIHLVSDRNPVKHMAVFHLGPRAGKAEISTRVRLAGSQNVTALAELSDGSYWMDTAHIQVTLSACADET
jgi:sulfur-oxidizing protein SoxY